MSEKDSDKQDSINTGGGAFIGGNIAGRDITARDEVHGDKFVTSGSGNIHASRFDFSGDFRGSSLNIESELALANEYLLSELRERLLKHFSFYELELLSFDFGADWDNLAGNSPQTKARALIAYALRRGRLDDLIRITSQLHPNVDWTVLPNEELNQITKATNARSADHLKIFFAYAYEDAEPVRSLYQRLRNDGFDIWLDSDNLAPGMDVDAHIIAALGASDVIVFVLSPQSSSSTFLSHTLDLALKQFTSARQGGVFIIPVLLAPIDLPEALKGFQAINYFEEDGYRTLIRALRSSAANLGVVPVSSHKER